MIEEKRMYNLEEEFKFCKNYMREIGIQIAEDGKISIKSSEKTEGVGGLCYGYEDGTFRILINTLYLNEKIPEAFLRSVIMHELLHTRKRSAGHGKGFQKTAKDIREKSGGLYDILLGISDEYLEDPEVPIVAEYECECGVHKYFVEEDSDYQCILRDDGKSVCPCPICHKKMEKKGIKKISDWKEMIKKMSRLAHFVD